MFYIVFLRNKKHRNFACSKIVRVKWTLPGGKMNIASKTLLKHLINFFLTLALYIQLIEITRTFWKIWYIFWKAPNYQYNKKKEKSFKISVILKLNHHIQSFILVIWYGLFLQLPLQKCITFIIHLWNLIQVFISPPYMQCDEKLFV